jgi:stage IV sporulation protein B
MKRKICSAVWSAVLAAAFTVTAFGQKMLIPVGQVVGLSLAEGSVTVAAFDDALGGPAREAGIRVGDEILSVDGKTVDSAADLHRALMSSDGNVELMLSRRGDEKRVRLSPAVTDQGPKLGVFIREGITGIGTVTYFDPEENCFGALGHGVSDSRGRLCAMRYGNVYRATVAGVRMGQPGSPGQLKGAVAEPEPMAALTANTGFGVFGTGVAFSGEALPIAEADEIAEGPAQILSNVSGSEIELYGVEIVKVYHQESSNGRDLMLKVTDPELLETTGGIVAGMSGSPIIQDGKLVGAVTHVLVNDPTSGYGIFIENMLTAAG